MRNFLSTLRRYKASSLLNILGLAAAFAAMYIMLVQVYYDFTYNRHLKDSERIYIMQSRDYFDQGKYSSWMNRPMAHKIIEGCPVVESFGCYMMWGSDFFKSNFILRRDSATTDIKLAYSQISFPCMDIIGFQATAGSFKELEKPNTIALSETAAKRYGIQIGDNIFYKDSYANKELSYSVVAIFPPMKGNNNFSSVEALFYIGEQDMDNWRDWNYIYLIKLKSTADLPVFNKHAEKMHREVLAENGSKPEEIEQKMQEEHIRLLPVSETYFSEDTIDFGRQGNKATTYILLAIAFLVVLIALINFINFFFALVPIRIRSVNTKKIFGCSVAKLRTEFIAEALGIVLIALAVAWIGVDLISTSTIAEYISAPLSLAENREVAVFTLFVAIGIGLIGSIYPAFYITSFPAVLVIKGSFSASKSGQRLRTTLIGLQFVISIALIISALFIHLQYSYMMNYDMGFDKEMLLSATLNDQIGRKLETREAFESKLKENPQIKEVVFALNNFIAVERMTWIRKFKEKEIAVQSMPVSWDFIRVMGIPIVEGRDFTPDDHLKENGTCIINETAAKEYGMVVGDEFHGAGKSEVIGICKDFNFRPMQYGILPFVFYIYGTNSVSLNRIYIRTAPNADFAAVKAYIEKTILEFAPEIPKYDLDVVLFDSELEALYTPEERISTLISLFTLLSIIISLMGVFGLVLFETQYRRREIGLRRVHGATVREILYMFNLKFVKIVLVCFTIAAPIVYFVIDSWLQGFAYRTPLYGWVFAAALIVILAITVLLVTLRSLKTATENPVDAIKSE